MKYIKKFAKINAVLAIVLLVPLGASAQNYVNAADVNVLQTAITGINNYESTLNQATEPPTITIVAAGQTAVQDLTAVKSHSFNNTLGAKYTQATNGFKTTASQLISDINNIDSSIQSNNLTAAQSEFTTFNTDVDQFNSNVQDLQTTATAINTSNKKKTAVHIGIYAAMLVATVLLSIGTFVWAKRQPLGQDILVKNRKSMFKATLFPVVGSVVTLVTYIIASRDGGTYWFAYGPIFIGLAFYFRKLADYNRSKQTLAASPVSNVAPAAYGTPPVATQPYGPLPLAGQPSQAPVAADPYTYNPAPVQQQPVQAPYPVQPVQPPQPTQPVYPAPTPEQQYPSPNPLPPDNNYPPQPPLPPTYP